MKRIHSTVEILSKDEIQAVHDGSLRILQNVGVRVPNKDCMDACRILGAMVDDSTGIVRIPLQAMERVLDEIRKAYTGSMSQPLSEPILGNISTQVFLVDLMNKARRYGTMEDVVRGIVLSDGLRNIRASNAVVVPHDAPEGIGDVLSYEAIYKYSKKPGGTYILSESSAKYIIRMAKCMGQNVSYFLETVSPLQFRPESLEMALLFFRSGMPVTLGPMVIGGATGPVSLAGNVALQNAEILASLFLIRALGTVFGHYGSYNHTMDLRTTLCSFGSPNQALLGMAAAQMGHFYGMRVSSNSGLSDAIMPDFQSGLEKASTALLSCMAGCTGIGAQGIVGADQGFSFEQLVIDNEWLDCCNYILNGFEVNVETIAADVVEYVGIGGNFLAEEHTLEHMRVSSWPSKLFGRDNWDGWAGNGSRDILMKAHDIVQGIFTAQYPPEPVIGPDKQEELSDIVKQARFEICGRG